MAAVAEQLQTALDAYRAGRLDQADSLYRAALAQEPANGEARFRLGLIAHRQGRMADAQHLLSEAVGLRPGDPITRYTLALVEYDLGQLDAAKQGFEAAIALNDGFAEAYNNLALVFQDQGNFDASLAVLRRALTVRPHYPSALNNLGVALRELRRLPEARQVLEVALRQDPNYQPAYHNLGSVFMALGDAVAAVANLSRSIELAPRHAKSHYLLGLCRERQGDLDAAISCQRRVIELQPDYVEAAVSLAELLAQINRDEEAITWFKRAADFRPGHHKARLGAALTLPVLYRSVDHLDAARQRYATQLRSLGEVLPLAGSAGQTDPLRDLQWTNFFLAYQGRDDLELQARYGRLVANTVRAALPDLAEPLPARDPGGGRLRVGFVSRFFRDCTVGHYFSAWITESNHEEFDILAYSLDTKEDVVTRRIEAATALFRRLDGDLPALARQIRADAPDILVYPEIGMDPGAVLLAAMRLAPVQCAAWGHPVTTGLPTIDHFLSCAPMEPADAQAHYAEKLLLLPGLGTCYRRPQLPTAKARADFKLPEHRTLYLFPQSLFKIHPDNDRLLARVLAGDPNGVLVFFGLVPPALNAAFLDRLSAAFAAFGMDGRERAILLPCMPREDYLRVNLLCDLMLDCLHWSGGQTSLDALACGLPIVTWPGAFMRGRQTAGMLQIMGVPELIAADEDDYVAIARRLGGDPAWRQALGERLRSGSDRLFDRLEPIRSLEAHFRQLGGARTAPATPAGGVP